MELLTLEALRLLERIDRAAPAKQGTNVFRAGIPWSLIHEVRAFLARIEAE